MPSLDEVRHAFGVVTRIVPQVEVPPKWALFLQVLDEIRTDYKESKCLAPNRGRVLLVTKTRAAAKILKDCATHGPAAYNDARFRWFVSMQSEQIRRNARGHTSDRPDRADRRGGRYSRSKQERATRQQLQEYETQIRRAAHDPKAQEEMDPYGLELTEKQLRGLSQEAVRMLLCERELRETAPAAQVQRGVVWAGSKREATGRRGADAGRGGGGGKRARVDSPGKGRSDGADNDDDDDDDDDDGEGSLADADGGVLGEDASAYYEEQLAPGAWANPIEIGASPSSQNSLPGGSQSFTASLLDPSLHLTITTIDELKGAAGYLEDCSPSYVVLYDCDVAVMRAVEVYHANCAVGPEPSPARAPLRVYLLSYQDSLDEAAYISALAKEKRAFEHLIETKRKLAICLPDILERRGRRDKDADRDLALSVDTRTVHRGDAPGARKVLESLVIDLREFRSVLPSQLYEQGLRLIPRTISVGDYVLAADICVERKSVSDLFQSLQSGRLYHQAEAMLKHYRFPCLLVEFTDTAPFCLQQQSYDASLKEKDVTSQLTALVLAFPQLRILWSRTIHATPDIFSSIAAGHDPCDELKAQAAGASAGGGGAGDTERVEADESARSILLSLPGVAPHNMNIVMDLAPDLCALSALSEDRLTAALGKANGRALHQFFRRKVASTRFD